MVLGEEKVKVKGLVRAVCFFSCKNQALLGFCSLKIGIEVSTKLPIAIDTDTQSPGIGSIDSWYRYRPPLLCSVASHS